MPGVIAAAILRILSSSMTPKPLGMADTSPRAEAPWAIAWRASSTFCMQQILILGGAMAADFASGYAAGRRPK